METKLTSPITATLLQPDRRWAGELVASEVELREYARNSFLRDNHIKYRKYCEEWLSGLTPEQWKGIRIWKYYEESGNLKK